MVDTTGAEAWRRAHALALETERHLEQMSIRHAQGAASDAQLAALQAEVQQLREAANAMFNAVFRFYES